MLRIATIGTSMITDDFIQVVNANDQATFVGTLSRDADRGGAFTAKHGGERNFTALDELASADDVDAVYIGSPNAFHYEQALACIAGGKHVIVEKPFCATEAQALEVFRAAEAAGVVALEAMRPLHDPAFHAVEDALGEIAPIRRASLRFGKYSSRYNEVLAGRATNIFDCHMASGSLMDIGVYAVEPMVEIFGMPSGLTSMTTLLDPSTQELTHGPIDGCGSILASYGSGHISVELAHSKITNDLLPSQIEGERGTIQIDHLSTPRNVRIDYRGDVVRGSATEAPRNRTTTAARSTFPSQATPWNTNSQTLSPPSEASITLRKRSGRPRRDAMSSVTTAMSRSSRCASWMPCVSRPALPSRPTQASRHSDGLLRYVLLQRHQRQSRASKTVKRRARAAPQAYCARKRRGYSRHSPALFPALGGASPRRWFSLYQHQPRAGTRTHRLGA